MIEGEDNQIIKEILNKTLNLKIKEIKYDENIQLKNITEYEFELIKVKMTLETDEEIEMYLKLIKSTRIKESIFCYWCSIYEEELLRTKQLEGMNIFVNKVLISELDEIKYQKRIFLTIENNKTNLLETGTEVNFIEICNYIEENKNEKNEYEKLYKYFDKNCDDVLLIGIKMNRKEKLH